MASAVVALFHGRGLCPLLHGVDPRCAPPGEVPGSGLREECIALSTIRCLRGANEAMHPVLKRRELERSYLHRRDFQHPLGLEALSRGLLARGLEGQHGALPADEGERRPALQLGEGVGRADRAFQHRRVHLNGLAIQPGPPHLQHIA